MESSVSAALWFGETEISGMSDLPYPPVPGRFVEYVLAKSGKPIPRVAILATASGDSDYEIAAFYRRMSQLECRASDLSITRYKYPDLRSLILRQDMLFIGDGSAPNLLALWRVNEIDEVIKEAAFSKITLCAEREGASALFEAYDTRARGSLEVLHDGLGILRGTLIRHLDKEDIGNYQLPEPVYVVEPSVAIEFSGPFDPYIIPFEVGGHAWRHESMKGRSPFVELSLGLT